MTDLAKWNEQYPVGTRFVHDGCTGTVWETTEPAFRSCGRPSIRGKKFSGPHQHTTCLYHLDESLLPIPHNGVRIEFEDETEETLRLDEPCDTGNRSVRRIEIAQYITSRSFVHKHGKEKQVRTTTPIYIDSPKPEPEKRLCCEDCQLPYSSQAWADVVIPNWVWKTIHPEDGGVLCFNCMNKRCIEAGFYSNVPFSVTSGAFNLTCNSITPVEETP